MDPSPISARELLARNHHLDPEQLNAAKSAQATLMATGTDPENPFYTYASGTSMATPHVAGAVALMLDAREALTPAHVIAILEGTADSMPAYEIFEVGMGHLDAHEAVRAAEKGKVRFPAVHRWEDPQYTLTRRRATPAPWWLRIPGTSRSACEVAGESAGLLDIGFVNHRALLVTNSEAGTWTVAVYGRINAPTAYEGFFATYDKNQVDSPGHRCAPPGPGRRGVRYGPLRSARESSTSASSSMRSW